MPRRRRPLRQRQDHPRPLPCGPPPRPRRRDPARRHPAAAQPARPQPRAARRRAVRLPGRPGRLRRTPARPGPGRPHGGTAARHRRRARHGTEARTTLPASASRRTSSADAPRELSGGELQRAALARALLARPRVLICDEITSGLDPSPAGASSTCSPLVRDRDDLSLVLITHDLDTAALAHRIAVLDAGELVEQGRAQRILTDPSTRSPCLSWRRRNVWRPGTRL